MILEEEGGEILNMFRIRKFLQKSGQRMSLKNNRLSNPDCVIQKPSKLD
jgi:hypothetical protein